MLHMDSSVIDWIKAELKKSGLRQKDLANHIGLAKSRMSEVMHGRRRLTVEELSAASKFFGSAPPDLIATPWPAPHTDIVRVPVIGIVGARMWQEMGDKTEPSKFTGAVLDGPWKVEDQEAFECGINSKAYDLEEHDMLVCVRIAKAKSKLRPKSIVVIERRIGTLRNWALAAIKDPATLSYDLISAPMPTEHTAKVYAAVIAVQRPRL